MIDNPWMWLLFAVVTIVVLSALLFVVAAVIAGVLRASRIGPKCPRCGHAVSDPWPPEH